MSISIAIAGTTERTVQCAKAIAFNKNFEISWVLTPAPKPIGRKKVITSTPLESYAKENDLPVVHVEKKLTTKKQQELEAYNQPDILLVVDFGYIVPQWLLELPRIAPVNIHPSELPKWRGSSPAQFAILYNEKETAVTLMLMDSQLDHGPIITQKKFEIDQSWTQEKYYEHAFSLICKELDQNLINFVTNYQTHNNFQKFVNSQPDESPTPTAHQIRKSDAFVPWEVVTAAQRGAIPDDLKEQLPKLLFYAFKHNKSLSLTLERASKAFTPWPQLWTKVKTKSGETRMKLLELKLIPNPNYSAGDKSSDAHLLKIETVHLAGKKPAHWEQVKTGVINS